MFILDRGRCRWNAGFVPDLMLQYINERLLMNRVTLKFNDTGLTIEVEAIVFDVDGTMIDNHAINEGAWIEFAKRYGINLDRDRYQRDFNARRNEYIIPVLFGRSIDREEVLRFSDEKETIYRENTDPLKVVRPGLVELVKKLRKHKVPLAAASNAPRLNVLHVIRGLGLEESFQVILGAEDASKGKPDPEVFFTASGNLNVDITKLLIFEDSHTGITAAKASGASVVVVSSEALLGHEHLLEGVITKIDDFQSIDVF